MSRFYETSTTQMAEIFRSYRYRDSYQHDTVSGIRPEERDTKPLATVNLCAPLVRAVAGSEVMAANTLDFISTDPNFDAEADVLSDSVEWCQYVSDYYSQRAMAAEDAATCGIGAIVTYLDMTQQDFIAGVPVTERVAPMFLAYDKSPRGGQLNTKGRWCAYADPVSRDYMDEYIEKNKEEGDEVSGGDYSEYILSYTYGDNQDDIEFIYHYFWREFTDIYDVANPFADKTNLLGMAVLNDDTVANMVGKFAADNALNWEAAYWTLDKESLDELKEVIETIQLLLQDTRIDDLEYSKRFGKAYYRAQFARGILLKKSLSYTQNGHALNFITGYHEENTGNYYGLMRPLSFIQDYLNITMADLMDYVRRATTGGSAYISFTAGNGDSIERIMKGKLNEEALTPVPAGTEIVPKALPATAEHLTSFIQLMIELMPRALGLGQEFFGVITSGDMTDSLYGKIMKQSFAVLENWKNASAGSDLHQGYIFQDLVRLMAEANDGMVLPMLSADGTKQAFFSLTTQSLASSYTIRIVERPLTKDERQQTFNKLAQLAPQAAQAGVNLFPMLARYAPMDASDREEMVKLATPQPPQPDPLDRATREATIAFTQAEAQRSSAIAAKTQAETQRMLQTGQLDQISATADIEKKLASTELDKAKAAETVANVGMASMDRIDRRIDALFNNTQTGESYV